MVIKTLPNEPYEELNGVSEDYDKNGQLVSKATYKNGKLNGVYEEYDDGQLVSKITYKNNERNGVYEEYYDGQLVYKRTYKNGEFIDD